MDATDYVKRAAVRIAEYRRTDHIVGQELDIIREEFDAATAELRAENERLERDLKAHYQATELRDRCYGACIVELDEAREAAKTIKHAYSTDTPGSCCTALKAKRFIEIWPWLKDSP